MSCHAHRRGTLRFFLAAALFCFASRAGAYCHSRTWYYGQPAIPAVYTSCCGESDIDHARGHHCHPPDLTPAQMSAIDEIKNLYDAHQEAKSDLGKWTGSKVSLDGQTSQMVQSAQDHLAAAEQIVKGQSDPWMNDGIRTQADAIKREYAKADQFMNAAVPGLTKATSKDDAAAMKKADQQRAAVEVKRQKLEAEGIALAPVPEVRRIDMGQDFAQRSARGVEKLSTQGENLKALAENVTHGSAPAEPPAYHGVNPSMQVDASVLMDRPMPVVGAAVRDTRAIGSGEPIETAQQQGTPDQAGAQAPTAKARAEKLTLDAWVLVTAGEYAKAEEAAKKALELDPKNAAALEVLALAQLRQGKYAEALRSASAAIELDPKRADLWAFRAYAKEMLGDRLGALLDIAEAAKLDPRYQERYRIAKAGGRICDESLLDPSNVPRRGPWGPLAYALAALTMIGGPIVWRVKRRRRRAGATTTRHGAHHTPRHGAHHSRGAAGPKHSVDAATQFATAPSGSESAPTQGAQDATRAAADAATAAAPQAVEQPQGTTVRQLLADSGHLGFERAAQVLQDVCAALESEQGRPHLYRELCPDDIQLGADGRARLMPAARDAAAYRFYRAPQRPGAAAGHPQAAIFSLGICLYEMLTGHLPFNRPEDVLDMKCTLPSRLVPALPKKIDEVFLRAAQPDPKLRIKTPGEFRKRLTEAAQAS